VHRALTPGSPAIQRMPEILERLRAAHPDACCALQHKDPLQLLVATILSAQCTDERVNQVTPALFQKYQTAVDFAGADRAELERMIRPAGFFRQKARFIQEACSAIVHEFNGQVPSTLDGLLRLTGVARKTANVVMGVAFGVASGIVVDTHVKRLSLRLDLTGQSTPEKIEQELMQIVPQVDWIDFSHLLIFHGRRVCQARKPACPHCTLVQLCPSAQL
jgi:endonuclease III